MPRASKNSERKDPKVVVLDLDDTLFSNSLLSRILQRISLRLWEFSLRFQKLNKDLAIELRRYERIRILSSRSQDVLLKATIKQLVRNDVRYDDIVLFPAENLKIKWKRQEIQKLKKGFDFYDDQKDEILRY